jgi:hypothetical protein
MGTEADDLDDAPFFKDLVDQTALEADPSRAGACQIALKLLGGRRSHEGTPLKDFQQFDGLVFEIG